MNTSALLPDAPRVIPCVLFEDDHLLVVDKPAGMNTHAPSPFAGEGIYDWLRHREPRWAALAILHRLDKETSGVMVFGKTPSANRSLTDQFTQREVHKIYLLLSDRPVRRRELAVRSCLARAGSKYASRDGGEPAETLFRIAASPRDTARPSGHGAPPAAGLTLIEAEPRTGRTHQIRAHAAESGFPILGDVLYGGTPAARVFLHAAELRFRHPETGRECVFKSPAPFGSLHESAAGAPPASPRSGAGTGGTSLDRLALIDSGETNAFRLIHGAADGWPGWHVERLGGFLLSQSEHPPGPAQLKALAGLLDQTRARGAYHKILDRQVRRTAPAEASPRLVAGEPAPDHFEIRENGARFELSFGEGYSVGLFLDQRDNRRRFLTGHAGAGFAVWNPETAGRQPELLNTFAYTCGFSVAAALGGARTTSLDLSKKYLDWGRRNFAINGLDPARHDFIFGDAFDWLRRLAKKGRLFDAVVLDPPTFSQSAGGVFRAGRDYGRLAAAALGVLRPGGTLFASANTAGWAPEAFVAAVRDGVVAGGRRVARQHFVPQPPDFPVSREEPAYLKSLWLRVD